MTRTVEVRRGLYRDSVALMQMSHTVAGLPGVETALIAMATPLNLDLLPGLGFEPEAGTSPDDLLVAITADDDDALASALRQLEELFSARESEGAAEVVPPRTTQSALRRSGAHLAVISVPGPNAFVEAMDALRQDADVMLFSDNVSVEQEIRLKDEAHDRGLLVMGPDCGTAIVGGVGLGFANVMQPGPCRASSPRPGPGPSRCAPCSTPRASASARCSAPAVAISPRRWRHGRPSTP